MWKFLYVPLTTNGHSSRPPPRFMEGVETVEQLDDRHTHWRIHVGPSIRKFDATITEQHPPSGWPGNPTAVPNTRA